MLRITVHQWRLAGGKRETESERTTECEREKERDRGQGGGRERGVYVTCWNKYWKLYYFTHISIYTENVYANQPHTRDCVVYDSVIIGTCIDMGWTKSSTNTTTNVKEKLQEKIKSNKIKENQNHCAHNDKSGIRCVFSLFECSSRRHSV